MSHLASFLLIAGLLAGCGRRADVVAYRQPDCVRPCTVMSALQSAFAITANATTLFAAEFEGGRVLAAPLTGGTAAVLAETGGYIYNLVADEREIVWADNRAERLNVMSVAGAPLASWPAAGGRSVVRDGDRIFWASRETQGGGIYVTERTTGATTRLMGGEAVDVLALAAGRVFYTKSEDGLVGWIAADGAERRTLMSLRSEPWGIAADERTVVWALHGLGDVYRAAHDGSALERLASGLAGPHSVAIVGDEVYVTEQDGGRLLALRSGGAAPRVIVADQPAPTNLVVVGPYAYWTNRGGSVMKVRR